MAENALKEFLVSMKYQIDRGSEQRFFAGLKQGEQAGISFGKILGGLGLAGVIAYKGTLEYSKGLEQLRFAARRTGTEVRRLHGMMIASDSLGSSMGEAMGSIEGLAEALRRNPMGNVNLLKSLGVDALDANGKMRDTVDIMNELAKSFQKMKANGQEFQVFQYADPLGIPYRQSLAMLEPGYVAAEGKFTAAHGEGVNEAAEKAHNLQNENRELEAREFGMVARSMTPIMDELTKTLKLTNNELNDLNGSVSWLVNLWNTNQALGNPAGKVALAGGALWAAKKVLSKGGAAAAGGAVASGGSRLFPALAGLGLMTYSGDVNPGEDEEMRKMHAGASKGGGSVADRQRRAVAHLMRMKFSRSEAIAIVANMTRESSTLNPREVGDSGKAKGIMQWHAPRQADFERMFGYSIEHASFEDQVEFAGWEMQNRFQHVAKKMRAAGDNHRLQAGIVSRQFAIPANADYEAEKRGQIAQTIHTTINVTGQKDPQATAEAISREQIKVNQTARNVSGSVR